MTTQKVHGTDLNLSAIALGTYNFGTPVGESLATDIINRVMDLGINHIDTANMYEGYSRYYGSPGGVAEKIIGKALKGRRDRIFLATKLGMKVGPDPEDEGLSRGAILKQIDRSLGYLQTDYVDILYLHKPDPNTPMEETLQAIQDIIQAGKIRYLGVSNFSVTELKELFFVAEKENMPRPVVAQPPYSLLNRDIEEDFLPLCIQKRIGVIPYQVLQEGLLTGKYKRNKPLPKGSRKLEAPDWGWDLTDEVFDRIEKIEALSKMAKMPMSQYSIAWVISQPGIVSTLVGVKNTTQLEEAVQATKWKDSDL